MKKKIKFVIKQSCKILLQNVILPCVYAFWRVVYHRREPDLIIFADAHHSALPFSMRRIHTVLQDKGYTLTDEIYDFAELGQLRSALVSIRFMKLYAQARYIFICDNFLPVASCRKSNQTTVIQLLHSCGLLKKMGYDTAEDIPEGYIGQVYKNYDLVTVSAPCCVEPLSSAMHLPQEIIKPLGISRTDYYFDPAWKERCTAKFYDQYPGLRGKKIILWAPTFRGNAGDPYQVGLDAIRDLENRLEDDCYILKKVHPHIESRFHLSNCSIPTEELFPVIDLLISDYSSVVNEFMLFHKPYLLFAPDLESYERIRGFYVPYNSLSPYIVTDLNDLLSSVRTALADTDAHWTDALRTYHLSACDGNATERILQYLDL